MSPTAALGPCRESKRGCPNLADGRGGYCWAHTRRRDRASQRRRAPIRRVYSSAPWKRLRKRKLARDPVCQIRLKCNGARATVVDHVHEISAGGAELPTLDELRSACKPCHDARTARDSLEWGRGGTG